MPFNAVQGSTIRFTAAFFNASQVVIVPSSASITISYPMSSNNLTVTSCSIGMTPNGQFFTATWASGVAALGLSNYSVRAEGLAVPVTGVLRLVTP